MAARIPDSLDRLSHDDLIGVHGSDRDGQCDAHSATRAILLFHQDVDEPPVNKPSPFWKRGRGKRRHRSGAIPPILAS